MNDAEDGDYVGLCPKDASSKVFGDITLLGPTHGDEERVKEASSLGELQV
jgi:hypothetical protein